jgi:hypothetical protein
MHYSRSTLDGGEIEDITDEGQKNTLEVLKGCIWSTRTILKDDHFSGPAAY